MVHFMEEARVVELFSEWLRIRSNVSQIQYEQQIIPGGLEADVIGVNSSGDWTYIVECKGSQGINEIVRGIGQAYQYYHQKQFSEKAKDAEIIFVLPRDSELKLSKLQIPENVRVYLVNDDGNIYERVRRTFSEYVVELQLPNTFYIRDIELDHIKKIIILVNRLSCEYRIINEDLLKNEINRNYPEIAAGGYNHLITMRSIGIINYKYNLSPNGHYILDLINSSDLEFKKEMTKYFYCFIMNVLNAMLYISKENDETFKSITCTHSQISSKICELWGHNVRFMYDNRTISTAIRIMKELGIIEQTRRAKYEIKKLVHPDYLPWIIQERIR